MQIRLAVFDMAGTTVTDPGLVARAFVEAMAAAGHAIDAADVAPLMGYRKPEAIARLLDCEPNDLRVAAIHADFEHRMLACYRETSLVAPLPGAEAVFAQLRAAGVKVALNTGFSRAIADTIVERLGWADRIDALIASDEVAEGRPAPHMIRTLMARLGIDDSRQVVKVGDTEVDVAEARRAGAGLAIAVTTGAFTRAELMPFAPDHIIDHLDALPGLIGLTSAAAVA